MKSKSRSVRRSRHRVRRGAPGASPGTINVDPQARPSTLRVIAYGPEKMEEASIDSVAALEPYRKRFPVIWVNVDGLGDAKVLTDLAERFKIHQLALEDVINVGQRPKVEDYDSSHFIVLRMPRTSAAPETEQLSLFFGKDFVISFQEEPGDCLEPVRNRLRKGKSRIRSPQPDYLAYAVIDAVVDGFYPLLDSYFDQVVDMENHLLTGRNDIPLARLYDLKRDLLSLRGDIRPLREAVSSLLRLESDLLNDATRLFLRDAYDHAVQLTDVVEHQQETASGLIELYRSNDQARLNEVMKVLTVTATIFIPLSFIAGVYGMNFDPDVSPLNMPELRWFWGYPFALLLMVGAALTMLGYFRRKGWIGKSFVEYDPEDGKNKS